MPTNADEKLQIQWDDLKTRKVDQRLKEQEALERNRRQAEMNPLSAQVEKPVGRSIWYNPIFTMAVFGLLGGLLAWGGGEILRFRPDPKTQADEQVKEINDLLKRSQSGQIGTSDADDAIAVLSSQYKSNPYFSIYTNASLTKAQKNQRVADLNRREAVKNFITNVLSFGLSGTLIATCLSIAEPTVDRNRRGMLVNGAAGASLGLVGGVVVSLFVEQLYNALVDSVGESNSSQFPTIIARAITWAILGVFLTIAPGLVMRNGKKFAIGVVGGLLGGLVGGALFDPVAMATDGNTHISRLVALLAIGVVAGASTGLIENAAKSGWLKVTAGLIAGKQFILYRNPTFIGSGPECQIYLFRDAKVGRRHAALHIVPGGFELENLPLGATTLVNGKSIERVRLRNGDKIQVGATVFSFAEKEKPGK
jgi:Inner membrane component of T3SS, cytoplasmic domain